MSEAEMGHLYQHGPHRVIAMGAGIHVYVRPLDPAEPLGMGSKYLVRAEWLTPLPMKYFHGQLPKVAKHG